MSSMQPTQGPLQGPTEVKQFLVNDNMQVKSSWGQRVVTAETPNKHSLTLRLVDVVAVLENQVKSAKSPEEIKRTREMFQTVKKLESGSRDPLTKFLGLLGIKNTYDKKFSALDKNITSKEIVALGRDTKIEQVKTLEKKLEKLSGKIDVAREAARKEYNENFNNRNIDGSDWDDIAQSRLEELLEKDPEKMQELNDLKKSLNSYPEYKKFGNEVGNVQRAAYEKYDQLYNIDNTEARLEGADIAAKEASGKILSQQDVNTMKFLESLNNIPKDIKLEIKNDPLLLKKKENFIANLKSDSPVKRLMENENLKQLAAEMDKGLSPFTLLQNFALNTVGVHPEDMKEFIEGKDMDNAFTALILLQKNTSFENVLNDLGAYTNKDLEVSAYKKAFAKINELDKVNSEIDEINTKLKNSIEKDDTELYKRQDALYDRVEELGS